MAKYELNIYGNNDEILKTYATNIVPWAVFIRAADLQEELKNKNAKEQMNAVGEILQAVFHELTSDELLCADGNDVMNTFKQIVSGGQKIKGDSKNG